MMCWRVLGIAAVLGWTASAAAEKPPFASAPPSLSSVGRTALPHAQGQSLAIPIVSYTSADGTWDRPRGIIAGHQIAPGTVLGIGIFQTTPKTRGYLGDVPQDLAPKKTKRAAIGLSMRF